VVKEKPVRKYKPTLKQQEKDLRKAEEAEEDAVYKAKVGYLRCRKIRWYPTMQQAATLRQCYGAMRFVYNDCIHAAQNGGDVSLQGIRARYNTLKQQHVWLTAIPYDIIDAALKEFDTAYTKERYRMKNEQMELGKAKTFQMKFRGRRDEQQTIVVRARNWDLKSGFYAPLFGTAVTATREPLPPRFHHDLKFLKTRLGHYYLCYQEKQTPTDMSSAPTALHSVVALDPGVRTFQTCYDADGSVIEWGAGDMSNIFKLSLQADHIQSKLDKSKLTKGRQCQKRLRKAWWRKLDKIKYKIAEVHKKMARWLCTTYRTILLPKFETSRMIKKRDRKLRSKTVRQMCTWAHFRFRQLLIAKAELFPWCKVIICDEAYTSKTCGQCGQLHQKLGGNKTFKCPQPTCHYVADRDMSAARNILLRYLTRTCASP